jgi:hypothetical protein
LPFDPFTYARRATPVVTLANGVQCGGEQTIRVVVTRAVFAQIAPRINPKADVKPEAVCEDLDLLELDPTQDISSAQISSDARLVTVKDGTPLPVITTFRLLAAKLQQLGRSNPKLLG